MAASKDEDVRKMTNKRVQSKEKNTPESN